MVGVVLIEKPALFSAARPSAYLVAQRTVASPLPRLTTTHTLLHEVLAFGSDGGLFGHLLRLSDTFSSDLPVIRYIALAVAVTSDAASSSSEFGKPPSDCCTVASHSLALVTWVPLPSAEPSSAVESTGE